MGQFALAISILWSTVSFVRGKAPSAAACGPTSVPNVPGCWGLDGCAYVIASDLGPGAACSYDYCNCNETPVSLLPMTISGTRTIGCVSYTTQPSVSKCPTAAPVIPAPGCGGGPRQNSTNAASVSKSGPGPSATLASGATVVVGTIAGGSTEIETFEPTTYTQFASITATITTTIVNAQGSAVAVVVGPSGVAWTPYEPPSGVSYLQPPSVLPGASPNSQSSNVPLPPGGTVMTATVGSSALTETFTPTTLSAFSTLASTITTSTKNAKGSPVTVVVGPSGVAWAPFNLPSGVPVVLAPAVLPGQPSSPASNVPLPSGATVVTATIGPSTIRETFVPTIVPGYASLASTITTSTLNAQSSPVTFFIGPGGVEWTPFNLPSGSPEIPPPTILPFASNARSLTQLSSITPTLTPGASPASYASVTDAFANTAQSQTTVIAGGMTIPYAIAIFPDLATISAVTTVTKAVTETNKDGTKFTIPAAIIIVGPGGRWWNGGTGGFGIHLPSCIWPFCPPGGGGDIDGVGSGEDPNDPDTPGSPEKPSDSDDPDDDDNKTTAQKSQALRTTNQGSSTQGSSTQVSSTVSSSCGSMTIASDCSVICSTPTGLSTLYCATDCYSTVTGCSATGVTISTVESGGACPVLSGWAIVDDTGDDFPTYGPLGSAGIAAPGGVTAELASTTPATNIASVTTDGSVTTTAPSGSTTSTVHFSSVTATAHSSSGALNPAVGSASYTATPTCMVDGAPWYSPTSWCDCGPSSTYPTLSPTAGATSANCAYTSLPASTLQPVSTGTAPTNLPGQNGVPGCAAVVSVPGTSAYCNCGGIPAPTLKPTSAGSMNCDYTIQPTSSYNPAIPPPASSAPPPPPYETGTCHLHLWQGLGQEYTDPEVGLDIDITDSTGKVLGYNASSLDWGQPLTCGGLLPDVLSATPKTGVSNSRRSASRTVNKRFGGPIEPRPLFEKGPVDFVYGTQTWDTSSAQCTVGGWDNGDANDFFGALIWGDDPLPNRQMDCTFHCPGPRKPQKREVAVPFGHPLGIEEEYRRNMFARDPSATTDDGPTAIDEHLFYVRALTDHGAAWQKYAPSGARYYAAWQAKTGDDAVYQCDFEDEFNVRPIYLYSPARSVQPLLSSLGIGIGREYYAISAKGPKNAAGGTFADFSNAISASQGVFLANVNDRGALPSDPNDPFYEPDFPNGRQPIPWQFSSVAWWMWIKTCLTANPSWVTNASLADYSGIKYFFRRQIVNLATTSILDEAFKDKDNTSTLTWTPADTDQDTNPFWALLGSPNGNGIIYFLTDNKVALKGKGIVSISATSVDEGSGWGPEYTMWATFD